MSTLKRFIANGPGALVVTIGLGVLMAKLIEVPFMPPQEREAALSFEINEILPEVEAERTTERPELKDVEVPPAPPIINVNTDQLPTEDPVVFGDTIPHFDPPDITIGPVTAQFEQDGGPLVRVPPIMPTRAEKSGHCNMVFDVNADGVTFNVRTLSCSQSIFSRSSIKAVQKWKYRAQIRDGQAMGQSNVRTTITFSLKDEHGNLIPE